jgi:hypothetical protein
MDSYAVVVRTRSRGLMQRVDFVLFFSFFFLADEGAILYPGGRTEEAREVQHGFVRGQGDVE